MKKVFSAGLTALIYIIVLPGTMQAQIQPRISAERLPENQYPSLDGEWDDSWGSGVWRIQHDSAYSEFTVLLPNRRDPYAGWFINESEISVEFTDDRGCCTGVLNQNATEIRWSNGAVWRR